MDRAKQKMSIDAKVIWAGLFNTTSTGLVFLLRQTALNLHAFQSFILLISFKLGVEKRKSKIANKIHICRVCKQSANTNKGKRANTQNLNLELSYRKGER